MKLRIRKKMEKICEGLPRGGRFFCALSGGIDSVTLLKALMDYRDFFDRGREIIVLHVNHNLRGKESDLDESFVRELCTNWNLPLLSTTLEKTKSSQESLRKKRMEFFFRHLKKEDRLFLGHHLDDQAETIMFRLIRGVGLRGLAGMGEVDAPIVRPLLSFSKAEIVQAAKDWNLKWREDSSNKSTKYERNWIRLELIPLLEARRPNFSKKLAALAKEAADLPKIKVPKHFESETGWELYSLADLKSVSTGDLSRMFSLSRIPSEGLKKLLLAGKGQLHAKRKNFWVSCGYLCVEPKKIASPSRKMELYRSDLGEWQLEEEWKLADETISGEKRKKLFQEKKIPTFLRNSIPILQRGGKIQLALPNPKVAKFRFSPTKAGKWFFSSSEFRDDRAVGFSKEKSPIPQLK
jgi:tRNA(Ile)-lysidine synthetase-like protein